MQERTVYWLTEHASLRAEPLPVCRPAQRTKMSLVLPLVVRSSPAADERRKRRRYVRRLRRHAAVIGADPACRRAFHEICRRRCLPMSLALLNEQRQR